MKNNPHKYGYQFNINGIVLLAICAKRASRYTLSKAVVDAINASTELPFCSASVGKNNDVDIVTRMPHLNQTVGFMEFDSEV